MYYLIGSQHSLYTGKLRAYLRWKGLPYEEVVASADIYKHVIVPRTGVTYIPVLVCPDQTAVLQDTHAIISHLECRHPEQPVLPSTPKQRLASMLLELYGDEWLVIPAMHFRWSYPEQEDLLLYHFGKTTAPHQPYSQQLALGKKLASRFAGFLPSLGICDASAPVIEARFQWQLSVLQRHLQQCPWFLSSIGPCTADFGFVGPFYAHLYLDPVPGKLMKCQAPLVADWVERTAGVSAVRCQAGLNPVVNLQPRNLQQPLAGALQVVRQSHLQQGSEQHLQRSAGSNVTVHSSSNSSSSSSSSTGAVECDIMPATLLPLLHHMFQEQLPVVCSTLRLLKAWIQQQQQQQIIGQQPSHSNSSSCSRSRTPKVVTAPDGSQWLVVPRNLGTHSYELYDPATGQLAFRGERTAFSYVAWRAAEIVEWFEGLNAADQSAVQQLLQQISAAGTAVVVTSGYSTAATAGSCGGSSSNSSDGVAPADDQHTARQAVASVPAVDAVAVLNELVELVRECGTISRMRNHVVVKLGSNAGEGLLCKL